MTTHTYQTTLRWTGNLGKGTLDYAAYSRNHEIDGISKSGAIAGSSDAHFRGDARRYNPEELLVASLSACHMLAYLHLCAVNNIVVTDYEDAASGTMNETRFTAVVLRPVVTISSASDATLAQSLHGEAHRLCFIANSVNFPVSHEPAVTR